MLCRFKIKTHNSYILTTLLILLSMTELFSQTQKKFSSKTFCQQWIIEEGTIGADLIVCTKYNKNKIYKTLQRGYNFTSDGNFTYAPALPPDYICEKGQDSGSGGTWRYNQTLTLKLSLYQEERLVSYAIKTLSKDSLVLEKVK